MITVAHVMGFSRIALAPASLVVVIDTPAARVWGAAIVVAAGITDILDGYFARRYGTVSRFGAALDITADRIFVSLALVGLLAIDRAPLAVVAIVLFREFHVIGLRAYAISEGFLLPKSPLGVAKLIVLLIGVCMALLTREVGVVVLWIAAALAVASAVWYSILIRRSVRDLRSVGLGSADGSEGFEGELADA